MSEYSLFCNLKKCRVAITTYAWITSCSHAFCEQHTEEEPEMCIKCLACGHPLRSKYDLVKVDLNPPEEFKSMVLTGLRPEIIMEIASRGIAFWCHQMFQEKLIHMAKANQAELQLNEVESSYQTLMVKMKNDREVENKNVDSLKKLSEDQTRRIQELEDCLNRKSQQLRSLQMKLEMMKRENLSYSLSQDRNSPSRCHLGMDRHVSPKFINQQSMLHCPINSTHEGTYHHRMPQKNQNDNTFQFKPNSGRESSQGCSTQFNFPSFTKH